MPKPRPTTGRTAADRGRRERLIRQVIRARRTVDAAPATPATATGDAPKPALSERARQWVQKDPPHGAMPSGPT